MATDAIELAAGREAATATWNAFPYYERRYGERGRLFCDSDTGWLITRCDAGAATACRDVEWLGDVLSARGMPRYLLETHLANLHGELVATRVWPRKRFTPLLAAARQLARRREAAIATSDFRRLSSAFDEAMHGNERRVERFGVVIVAAVADEASGVDRAVDAVTDWACDESLFDAGWIARVHATVAEARSLRA
jgi:hypothetical protein